MQQDDALESRGVQDALRDPVGVLRRRWRWMLVVFVAGFLAAAAFAAMRKPRYAATATLLVTTQQIREDLVRTTLQDDLLEGIDGVVGKVLSRERLADLIQKHDPYPELRESSGMSETAARVREDIDFTPVRTSDAPRPDPSTLLFALSMEADRPDIAAAFVNDLAARLVNLSIQERTQDAELALSFLRGELGRAEREMRELAKAIREFNEKYRGELPGELESNLARLDRLQQQRQSLALQIAEANTRLAQLVTGRSAEGVADQTPEARLAALRAQLKQRESVLTEKHPEIQSLRRQIGALDAELASSPGGPLPTRPTLMATSQQTLAEFERQLAQTEAELADLDARVARTPARQEELAALEERQEVVEETYRQALRKVHEGELAASLESAQQGQRVSVLDEAVPPVKPTRSRWALLAQGFAGSLVLSIALGLLLETLDPVLGTARQVENESRAPVLGSAPHLS